MKFRFDESCKIEGSEYILPYIISKWHDNIDVAYIYDYIVLNKRINKIAKEYGIDRDYILNLLKIVDSIEEIEQNLNAQRMTEVIIAI